MRTSWRTSGSSLVSAATATKGLLHRVPQRTCVACRTVRPKRELVRVVRLASGWVEVDATGKKSGRGAYLCGQASCWELGLKGARLARALRAEISPDNRQQLAEYAQRWGQPPIGGERKGP